MDDVLELMEKVGEELGLAVDELERAEKAYKAGDDEQCVFFLGTLWRRLVSVTVTPELAKAADFLPPPS